MQASVFRIRSTGKKKLFLIQQMILQNSSCTKRLRTEMNKREQRTQHVSKLWVSSCLVKLINSLLPGVVAIRRRWKSNSNRTNTNTPNSTWLFHSQGRGFGSHVRRIYFSFRLKKCFFSIDLNNWETGMRTLILWLQPSNRTSYTVAFQIK